MKSPRARDDGEAHARVRPVSVLTVDDQAAFREVARQVIEATEGFVAVGEASCGEDALSAVERSEPDLVLLDVRMPGLGGIETARRITAEHPDVLVVLVSVAEISDLPAVVHGSGAAELVRKQDFGTETLRRVWATHRGGKR